MLTEEELSKLTVFEIKSYAKSHGINLKDARSKPQLLALIRDADPSDAEPIIIRKEIKKESEKVALYVTHHLSWKGLGELKKGYNIVSREDSSQWLRHRAVRVATPEELARSYGK